MAALQLSFSLTGKVGLGEVDSWTTAEEFAANLLQERGITETSGWTVSLTQDDTVVETPGLEYVLDLIGEKELPPSFPKVHSSHLNTGKDLQCCRGYVSHDFLYKGSSGYID